MSVTMRVIQRFQVSHSAEFLKLERKFAELERKQGGVRGRRMLMLSGPEPTNTLVWEAEFPDVTAAFKWYYSTSDDAEHEKLLVQQLPLFEATRIEVYQNLEY